MPDKFGDESVEQYSEIVNKQFDNINPNWYSSTVQLSELRNESGIFQLGYDESTQFISYESDLS